MWWWFFSPHNPCFQEPSGIFWLMITMTSSNSLTFSDLSFLICETKGLDEVSCMSFSALKFLLQWFLESKASCWWYKVSSWLTNLRIHSSWWKQIIIYESENPKNSVLLFTFDRIWSLSYDTSPPSSWLLTKCEIQRASI